MKKVSVIVPIYNVEQYIERCAVSLFQQDFEDIEYIFVNDGTPDNSMDVLQKTIKKYPNRATQVKIFHHSQNKGLGVARNTGFKNAIGEYIINIDSDDWCELDMISSLYAKAKETDADIVVCDTFINYNHKEVYRKQECAEDNLKNLFLAKINAFLPNKLIKRELYIRNKLSSPAQISMAEDRWLSVRLFFYAKKIVHVSKALYHYSQENTNSICSNISFKTWDDLRWYVQTTEVFLKEKNLYQRYKKEFLINNLFYIIWLSEGNNYKKNIKYVSPKSDKLKYLWQIPTLNIGNKLIFSFYILNLPFVANFLIRCKDMLRKVLKSK